MSIAIEEADESWYWLELIRALEYKINKEELEWILNEAEEIKKNLSQS